MPVTVRPTRTDKEIARIIARNTTPTMEETAEILTWGADEHVFAPPLPSGGCTAAEGLRPSKRRAIIF
jgi:hypothetical protein